jgi:hypothetical protein
MSLPKIFRDKLKETDLSGWRIEDAVNRPSGHQGFFKVFFQKNLMATFKTKKLAEDFLSTRDPGRCIAVTHCS